MDFISCLIYFKFYIIKLFTMYDSYIHKLSEYTYTRRVETKYDIEYIWQNIIEFILQPHILRYCLFSMLLLIVLLLKWASQGCSLNTKIKATKKVILMTDATTKIGKEVAIELAKREAIIYIACPINADSRKIKADIMNASKSNKVFLRNLDLENLQSIRSFVDGFVLEEKRLDILINNSMIFYAPQGYTRDGFERHIGVNHLGHFYLTNLLVNLLMKSAPSRIIVLASRAHVHGTLNIKDLQFSKNYDIKKAYYQSKLSNVLFVKHLAKRLQGTLVTVNVADPGLIEQEFQKNLLYKILCWPILKTHKNAAQTLIYGALSTHLENVTGKIINNGKYKKIILTADNQRLAQWLWVESEKLTKLYNK